MTYIQSDSNDSRSYLNTRYFERQLIFSIDMDSYEEGLKGLMNTGIGRYDPVSGKAFFFLMKGDRNYPEIMMRIQKQNYRIKDTGEMVWYNVRIPSFSDRRIIEKLRGKPFAMMDDAAIYPFTIYSGGRIYFTVQYREGMEQEITERALSSLIAYRDILGQNSFRIESIGSSFSIPSVIRGMGMSQGMSEIDIMFYRRDPPKPIGAAIPGEKGSIKWPIDTGSGITIGTFEKALSYVDMPDTALIDIHDLFIRSVISSLYFEVFLYEKNVLFRVVIEDELVQKVLNVLAMVVKDGGRLSLRRVEKV